MLRKGREREAGGLVQTFPYGLVFGEGFRAGALESLCLRCGVVRKINSTYRAESQPG